MLTNKDIELMSKVFATKKDLKDFLTKDEFNKKFDKMLVEQINMKEDVQQLRKEMMTKEDKDEILSAIDSLAKGYKDHETEHAANIGAHDRFEKRITKLEKTVRIGI